MSSYDDTNLFPSLQTWHSKSCPKQVVGDQGHDAEACTSQVIEEVDYFVTQDWFEEPLLPAEGVPEAAVVDACSPSYTPPPSPLKFEYFDTQDWFDQPLSAVPGVQEAAVADACSPELWQSGDDSIPRRQVSFLLGSDEVHFPVRNTFLDFDDMDLSQECCRRRLRPLKTAPPETFGTCRIGNSGCNNTPSTQCSSAEEEGGGKAQIDMQFEEAEVPLAMSSVSMQGKNTATCSEANLMPKCSNTVQISCRADAEHCFAEFPLVVKNTFLNLDTSPKARKQRRLKTAPPQRSLDQEEVNAYEGEQIALELPPPPGLEDYVEGGLTWPPTPSPCASCATFKGLSHFMMPPVPQSENSMDAFRPPCHSWPLTKKLAASNESLPVHLKKKGPTRKAKAKHHRESPSEVHIQDTGMPDTAQSTEMVTTNVTGSLCQQPQLLPLPGSVHLELSQAHWCLDARKLLYAATHSVSLAFKVSFGKEFLDVPFKLLIHPMSRNGTFKNAHGRGSIQLKCEAELPRSIGDVSFGITIGSGKHKQTHGPFQHNFSENAICGFPSGQEEWNFSQAVELKSMTLDLFLEIAPCSSA